MTRRQFLHGVAAAGAATMLPARIFSLPAAPGMEIVRTATDRVELRLPSGQRRFRILQLTDTHFGTNSDANRAKDAASRALIRQMHHAHQPDLLFHTGDFVNNDKENPVHAAYDFMNDLGTPWALVYGNHDHPNGKPGQLSLDELAKRQENSISGWASRGGNERDYCWRAELMQDGETRASLFAFNTGDPQTGMIINPGALTHTSVAILDALKNLSCPIIELHISNPHQREAFRHVSYVTPVATATMCGLGVGGYPLAIEAMDMLVRKARPKA